jgi:hypothetical protein
MFDGSAQNFLLLKASLAMSALVPRFSHTDPRAFTSTLGSEPVCSCCLSVCRERIAARADAHESGQC